MSVISFLSEGDSEGIVTGTMAAVATCLALQKNIKILLMNTKYNDTSLDNCFWDLRGENSKLSFKSSDKIEIDSGIKGLSKAVLSNKTSPELIANYTRTIFKDRLEIISDKKVLREEYEKEKKTFREIIKMAKQHYDFVFVNIEGDVNDNIVYGMLEESDLFLINLSQRIPKIEEYMKTRQKSELLNNENKMIIINRHDGHSKYNVRNLMKYMKERDLFAVPYNTLFFEACNEGKVADFFIKFRKISSTNVNASFMNAIEKITGHILIKLNMLKR